MRSEFRKSGCARLLYESCEKKSVRLTSPASRCRGRLMSSRRFQVQPLGRPQTGADQARKSVIFSVALRLAPRDLPDGSRETPGPRRLLQTIARRWLATIAAVEAEAERIGMGRMICTKGWMIGADTPGLGPHATRTGCVAATFRSEANPARGGSSWLTLIRRFAT
jgi:hypothetical protein